MTTLVVDDVSKGHCMLAAALLSLGVVFLAELGDRSQLITMSYALRFRWWVVLSGVAIAAGVAHGISVTVGHFLGAALPERPMAFASAIAFLIFAVWAWREGTGDDGESAASTPEPRFALLTVVSSFALADHRGRLRRTVGHRMCKQSRPGEFAREGTRLIAPRRRQVRPGRPGV